MEEAGEDEETAEIAKPAKKAVGAGLNRFGSSWSHYVSFVH